MLSTPRRRAREEQGFTLIELLVVVLIIGILAAIAIPSFLNQRDKATDSAAKSGARTAQTAMETYLTDSPNQNYDGATGAKLKTIEPTLNEVADADLTVTESDTGYVVAVKSKPTNNVFTITRSSSGTVTRTCTIADADKAGGCRVTSGTSGTW